MSCKESKPMGLLEVLIPVRWCFSDGVLCTYWLCCYPGLWYMVFFTLPRAAAWSLSGFVVFRKCTYILTQSSKILKSYISLSLQRDYYYRLLFIVSLLSTIITEKLSRYSTWSRRHVLAIWLYYKISYYWKWEIFLTKRPRNLSLLFYIVTNGLFFFFLTTCMMKLIDSLGIRDA